MPETYKFKLKADERPLNKFQEALPAGIFEGQWIASVVHGYSGRVFYAEAFTAVYRSRLTTVSYSIPHVSGETIRYYNFRRPGAGYKYLIRMEVLNEKLDAEDITDPDNYEFSYAVEYLKLYEEMVDEANQMEALPVPDD